MDPAVDLRPQSGPDRMRIMLADDGSLSAGYASALVAGLPWPEGSCLQVVAAVDDAAHLFEPTLEDVVRQRLVERAAQVSPAGVSVEPSVLRGHPGAAIVAAARRARPDLVVVGSRSRGTYGHLGLGPISSFVVERAHAHVLVARQSHVSTILLAHDGSRIAHEAVSLLATWPIFAGVRIHVVSVVEIPDALRHLPFAAEIMAGSLPGTADVLRAERTRHQAWLAEARYTLETAGRTVTTETRIGVAARELLAAADVVDADVVVIGDRGPNGQPKALGRVCLDVLMHATASVLLVRSGLGSRS